MASEIILPFNHQPFSTDDKVASYTVPAGYYARATFITADCTFDSKNVFFAESYSTGSMAAGDICYFDLGWNDYMTITRTAGTGTITLQACNLNHGAATETLGAISSGGTSEALLGRDMYDVLLSSVGAAIRSGVRQLKFTNSGNIGTYTITTQRAIEPVTLWFPTGTVLDGLSYHVEIYPELS